MMKNLRVTATALLLAIASPLIATAAIELPPLFSDGMVLQRERPVIFWGKGDAGTTVSVNINGKEATGAVESDGNWKVVCPAQPAGGPYEVTVKAGSESKAIKDVYFGEVWLAGGQSNMQMTVMGVRPPPTLKADPLLRIWTTPRRASLAVPGEQADLPQKWQRFDPAEKNALGVSAVGYAFAAKLRAELGVPVALLQCNWGGTPAEAWVDRAVMESNPIWKAAMEAYDKLKASKSAAEWRAEYDAYLDEWKQFPAKMGQWVKNCSQGPKPAPPKFAGRGPYSRSSPTALYENMILTVAPYTLGGFIFYQGEGNAAHYGDYAELMTKLIGLWRRTWGDNSLPFYFVQISSWVGIPGGPQAGGTWPGLRQAQTMAAATVPNTGLAVSLDLGERTEIHYPNKFPVGERLAALALNKTYGKKVPCLGPQALTVSAKTGELTVSFSDAGKGLAVQGSADVNGFEIVAADNKPVTVVGKITTPNQVTLKIPAGTSQVKELRYGWEDFPEPMVNLYNSDGLPAYPFQAVLNGGTWSAPQNTLLH